MNNAGQISPAMASKIAYDQGIKVYTVGVGKRGKAPYPMIDMFGNQSFAMADVEIDEELLRSIAAETGGEYFRAENNDALKAYTIISILWKRARSRWCTAPYIPSFSAAGLCSPCCFWRWSCF